MFYFLGKVDMKKFEFEIKELIKKVHNVEENEQLKQESVLPGNCYFLTSDSIVSYGNKEGDARYPYAYDGLTLWAYASGSVIMEESTFKIFPFTAEAKEPRLAFFAGIKEEDGHFPISLLGPAKQPREKGVKRYAVYTLEAAYYFTESPQFLAVVRMLVDDKKLLRFSLYLQNKSDKPIQTYLSAYINPFLMQSECEALDTKFYKNCQAVDGGYIFTTAENPSRDVSLEHFAVFMRSHYDGEVLQTTSKSTFTGSMHNQLYCAEALFDGKFAREKLYTEFTETAILGEILPLTLASGESVVVSYTGAFSDCKENAFASASKYRETATIDEYISKKQAYEANKTEEKLPEIKFSQFKDTAFSERTFNYFLENVLRQVEFCSRSKNYAGSLIGIRDIFQQLEVALVWLPKLARKRIIDALNYIGVDGRAPRQYSYRLAENVLPKMDLREFIDQGVWIISTMYSYLAHTDDYSILDELCGYYIFDGQAVDFCDKKDTVLEHLICITDFLLSNLAEDTGCLRALYGDWNDALDGLGYTERKDTKFGSGVSVMASLQLYRNLGEMCEILKKVDRFSEKQKEYENKRVTLQHSLQKYAIVQNEAGERRILHGWFDKRNAFISSFCDVDGEARDGLTANAFWILCNAISWDETLKTDILQSYKRLDSKFGLKTFEPHFAKDCKEVGRIKNLPKGTAENGATYIHATLFAILSLFEVGEAEMAWEQIYKILPFTHERVSATPFIMPNSYSYDEEKDFNGESISDWFTGSGCVLIKTLIRGVFGFNENLNEVEVAPAKYLPSKEASITMMVKDCAVTISYQNKGQGKRLFYVNGTEQLSVYDKKRQIAKIVLDKEMFANEKLHIEIVD